MDSRDIVEVGAKVVQALDHISDREHGCDFAAIPFDSMTIDGMERVYVMVTNNADMTRHLDGNGALKTSSNLRELIEVVRVARDVLDGMAYPNEVSKWCVERIDALLT